MDFGNVGYKRFILPYAIGDVNRKDKSFTFEMEVAAVVCLAEGQRRKGRLLGDSSKISFVSKVHYALWAIPWGDRCLILDGLGTLFHKEQYFKPPDINLFTEDLKRNSNSREDFSNALKKHAKSFRDFAGTIDIPLNAVVAKKTLLNTLFEYLRQGTFLDENLEPPVMPFGFEREDALESREKLIQHWRQVQSDIKGFQYVLEVLNEGTNLNERGILYEIEQLNEKCTDEISELKPVVEANIRNLMKKREAEAAKMTKAAERKLKIATEKKEKYERRLQTLERNAFFLHKRVEVSKRKRDESRVARWSYELKRCQRDIDVIKTEIKTVFRLIEHTRKEGEDAVREVEERYRVAVEQEESKITDLTALRDSEIAAKNKEREELLSESSSIKGLVEQLLEAKNLHATRLREEITIPWKLDEVILIHLPFYLVRYEKGSESEYRIHPPVFATDHKGISRTIQRALRSFSLESRINLLLRPRSKELSELLSSTLLSKIGESKEFEEKISLVCRSNNIFSSIDFEKALTQGLEGLREEGWVSPDETQMIMKEYGGSNDRGRQGY